MACESTSCKDKYKSPKSYQVDLSEDMDSNRPKLTSSYPGSTEAHTIISSTCNESPQNSNEFKDVGYQNISSACPTYPLNVMDSFLQHSVQKIPLAPQRCSTILYDASTSRRLFSNSNFTSELKNVNSLCEKKNKFPERNLLDLKDENKFKAENRFSPACSIAPEDESRIARLSAEWRNAKCLAFGQNRLSISNNPIDQGHAYMTTKESFWLNNDEKQSKNSSQCFVSQNIDIQKNVTFQGGKNLRINGWPNFCQVPGESFVKDEKKNVSSQLHKLRTDHPHWKWSDKMQFQYSDIMKNAQDKDESLQDSSQYFGRSTMVEKKFNSLYHTPTHFDGSLDHNSSTPSNFLLHDTFAPGEQYKEENFRNFDLAQVYLPFPKIPSKITSNMDFSNANLFTIPKESSWLQIFEGSEEYRGVPYPLPEFQTHLSTNSETQTTFPETAMRIHSPYLSTSNLSSWTQSINDYETQNTLASCSINNIFINTEQYFPDAETAGAILWHASTAFRYISENISSSDPWNNELLSCSGKPSYLSTSSPLVENPIRQNCPNTLLPGYSMTMEPTPHYDRVESIPLQFSPTSRSFKPLKFPIRCKKTSQDVSSASTKPYPKEGFLKRFFFNFLNYVHTQ